MIKNSKQLKVSETARDKFVASIEQLERELAGQTDPDPIAVAYLGMMRADKTKLDNEIAGYNAAVTGAFEPLTISRLDSLGPQLVSARIFASMTQEMLANQIGCKAQQIQRYEQSGYATASLARLQTIAAVLVDALAKKREVRLQRRSS